jgi:hypothetical protein
MSAPAGGPPAPDHDAILQKRILNVEDVATLLGVSGSAVRRMDGRGALVAGRIGERYFFDRDLLLARVAGAAARPAPPDPAALGLRALRAVPRGRRARRPDAPPPSEAR